MQNWRNTLVDILRSSGGKSHLSEIYSQIEIKGNELGEQWKAGARGNLERNSSDCDAWDKKYDIFELKQKGSGNWSLKTNAFRESILKPITNFFILTTGKKGHIDKDFKIYSWNKYKNNKLKSGDLFIYRIPQKTSQNNQFYFFGAGQIGAIKAVKKNEENFKEGDVFAEIINPIIFSSNIVQSELNPKDFDSEKGNWMYTFGQYGMDEIPLSRFLFLLNKGTNNQPIFNEEENKIGIVAHNKIITHNYSVEDIECGTQKSRGHFQKIFREKIVLPNYQYKCAITGIETVSLLTAAHIIRWADDKNKRLDPQNGICLSKLVDKCFEDKLIIIDEEYKIRLSGKVQKDKKLFEELIKYEGKKLDLPQAKVNYPKKEYLKIHRGSA